MSDHYRRFHDNRSFLEKDEEINAEFPKNASWKAVSWESLDDKAYHGKIYITDKRIIFEGEMSVFAGIGKADTYVEERRTINLEEIVQFKYSVVAQTSEKHFVVCPFGPELIIEKRNGKSEKFIIPKTTPAIIEKLENLRNKFIDKLTSDANDREIALDHDAAIQIWEKIGEPKEATRVRKLKADLAAPKTEIHGDYVDDRDTIIKDSVLNRSTVGGGGGSSKMQELKELKEMFDSDFISEEEMEKMKKEILNK